MRGGLLRLLQGIVHLRQLQVRVAHHLRLVRVRQSLLQVALRLAL